MASSQETTETTVKLYWGASRGDDITYSVEIFSFETTDVWIIILVNKYSLVILSVIVSLIIPNITSDGWDPYHVLQLKMLKLIMAPCLSNNVITQT